jgi:hypothetical protein
MPHGFDAPRQSRQRQVFPEGDRRPLVRARAEVPQQPLVPGLFNQPLAPRFDQQVQIGVCDHTQSIPPAGGADP